VCGVVKELWPSSRVAVFGSRATSLVMPNSDWDLVVFGATPAGTVSRHRLAKVCDLRVLRVPR
jgi:DNA polymerase sigma